MVKLAQDLQDVYSKWEAKSRPRISGNTNDNMAQRWNTTVPVRDSLNHGPRNGTPRGFRSSRSGSNRHDIDRVRVPAVLTRGRGSKVLSVGEEIAEWKRYAPPIRVPELETVRYFALECCPKCLPRSQSCFALDKSITWHGLDDALIPPSDGRSWLTPLKLIKNSIYLTCKDARHNYKPISQKMLGSKNIEHAINRAMRDDPEIDKEEHRKRAVSIFQRMHATISTALLRLAAWLTRRLLSRMLTGVYVPKGQIALLKRASEHNIPMVYLPVHRSHLDYVLVTFLLYLNGLRVPLVAAGDNLLIPLFGTLLRGLGGFFVKCRPDFKDGQRDYLYRAILEEYVTEILEANHSLEFFLEHGRSRTGKTRLPKPGLLSVIVNYLQEDLVQDVYIVPVSISYEKVLDGNFVHEQLGEPKVTQTFASSLRSIWHVLRSTYGCVRVDFCQPFSVKEFLESARSHRMDLLAYDCPSSLLESLTPTNSPQGVGGSTSTNSLCSTGCASDDCRHVVKSLTNHVIQQSSKSQALMSTNLVAFLLLTKHRKGATLQQLAQSLSWLRVAMKQRDHQVMCLSESAESVRHACALLGKGLVLSETVQIERSSGDTKNTGLKITIYRPMLRLPGVLELRHYADPVLNVFVRDSIVATALLSLVGDELLARVGSGDVATVSRKNLASKCQDLVNILQHEFILVLPCGNPVWAVADAIDSFVMTEILRSSFHLGQPESGHHRRNWSHLEDLDEEDGKQLTSEDEHLTVILNEENISTLEFLQCTLASYVESYWVVACSLSMLVNAQMEEEVFFRKIQDAARDRLRRGLLYYEESFAAHTLRNAVKLYKQWGIVERHGQDSVRILYLSERWNRYEAVDSVISFVGAYRQ